MNEVIENGMVIGAEAAWDAKELKADLWTQTRRDNEDWIRKNFTTEDVQQAVRDAPVHLREHLEFCVVDGDWEDMVATISDMINYEIEMRAEAQTEKDFGHR